MSGVLDHVLRWGVVVFAIPIVLVTLCLVAVTLITLTARRPATRRHCLEIMERLTQYVRVLRGTQ